MTESPIEWHPDADFFRVVCRLGGLGPDGLDPDTKPDLTARAGTVAIRSTAPNSILVKTEADGHDRIIGYSGDIYNVDAATGELIAADGTVGLQLLSPSSDRVRPQGYPYRATIKLGVGGPSVSVTFDATPTHPDGTVDLARLVVEPIMDGATPTTVAQQLAAMQAQIDSFAVDPALIAAEVEDYLTANPLDADPAGTAASAVTAHELAADPHPQYVTADDLSGYLTTVDAPELIRDTMGTALVAGSGVTITPDDGANTIIIGAEPTTSALADIQGVAAFQGRSLRIGLASDSTGNGVEDWPTLWLKLLAAANPTLRVDTQKWDAATQTLGAPSTIQAGSGGVPASGGIAMVDDFNRTGTIIGSTSSGGQVWSGAAAADGGEWTADGSRAVPAVSQAAAIAVATGSKSMDMTVELDVTTVADAATRQLRFIAASPTPYPGTTYVWAQISVNPAGSPSLGLWKAIAGTPTALASTVYDVGLPTGSASPTHCTISLTVDIQNVVLTLTTPTKTTTLTGLLAESDVAVLGTYAGLSGAGSLYAVDSISIETPYTPAQAAAGVTLYNGSVAGASLTYHATRLAQMFPDPLDVMMVAIGHNNGSQTGAAFAAEVADFVALVRASHPTAKVIAISQNPQFAPAANPAGHAARQAALRPLAAEHGWAYVGVFEAFARETERGQSLVMADGVHPTTPPSPYDPTGAYGAVRWAEVVQAAIEAA